MAMTIDQQRAVALASARLRLKQKMASPEPKFGDPGVGDPDVPGYSPLPEEMHQASPDPNLWQKARPYIAPTVETLGAMGGGLGGAALGAMGGGVGALPGGVVGAGLGYGAAKELMELGDVYLGGKAPRQGIDQQVGIPLSNVLEGAAYEVGGRVAAPVIAKGLGKVAGTLKDLSPSKREAQRILAASTEGKVPQVRNALASAKPGEIPSDVLARKGVNVPVTQSVLKDAKTGATTHFSDISAAKETKHLDDLAKIAGGETQLEALGSRTAAKKVLQSDTLPVRDLALKHAEEFSDLMQGARDADIADVAIKDAGRRLEEAGLKPLNADDLVSKISSIKSPTHAGNDVVDNTVRKVIKEINKWSKSNQVVDPIALDALLKNSANSVVSKLGGLDAKAQSKAAAAAIKEINPIIDDAIEQAGGYGYKAYKTAYHEGMNRVANKKMAAKLMEYYKKGNSNKFVAAIEGDSPVEIEKILGPGRRNLETELGEKEFSKLKAIADDLKTAKEVTKQAEEGEKALRRVVEDNRRKFRLPDMFNIFATTANKALGAIETKINKKSFQILTEAAKDSKTLDDLLAKVPATERIKVLKIMTEPETFSKLIPSGLSSGVGVTGKNALSEKREKRNALSR